MAFSSPVLSTQVRGLALTVTLGSWEAVRICLTLTIHTKRLVSVSFPQTFLWTFVHSIRINVKCKPQIVVLLQCKNHPGSFKRTMTTFSSSKNSDLERWGRSFLEQTAVISGFVFQAINVFGKRESQWDASYNKTSISSFCAPAVPGSGTFLTPTLHAYSRWRSASPGDKMAFRSTEAFSATMKRSRFIFTSWPSHLPFSTVSYLSSTSRYLRRPSGSTLRCTELPLRSWLRWSVLSQGF